MSQVSQAFAHRGEIATLIPKGSTQISSGDYVAMPRNSDPISRAVLGAEGAISPAGSAYACQWGVGIADSDFNTNAVGATLYATPTASQSLPVIRKGVVNLALAQTSGKAGDLVVYASGATGAQVFKINNFRRDVAVGYVFEDFSGATANDPQKVALFEKPLAGKDIYFHLGNSVLLNCHARAHSAANQQSTQINMGLTGEHNLVIIKNKVLSLARVTDFTVGPVAAGGQSAIRFYWLAAKVSTTGGAVAFTKETCEGPFSAFASWTNSGISAGMMIPLTWTSNMVPIGLVIGWSATATPITEPLILNLGAGGFLPNGTKAVDHTTWYL